MTANTSSRNRTKAIIQRFPTSLVMAAARPASIPTVRQSPGQTRFPAIWYSIRMTPMWGSSPVGMKTEISSSSIVPAAITMWSLQAKRVLFRLADPDISQNKNPVRWFLPKLPHRIFYLMTGSKFSNSGSSKNSRTLMPKPSHIFWMETTPGFLLFVFNIL